MMPVYDVLQIDHKIDCFTVGPKLSDYLPNVERHQQLIPGHTPTRDPMYMASGQQSPSKSVAGVRSVLTEVVAHAHKLQITN